LDYFEQAVKITPFFQVVNIASAITGFIPTVTTQAVSISLQITSRIGQGAYTRTRTGDFLSQLNKEFFQPRGLYCLIMTYLPDEKSRTSNIDVSKIINKNIAASESQSQIKSGFRNLRASDATVKGVMQLPEAAPLIFPALDTASEAEKQSFTGFARDYFDRRAQATHAAQNPGSVLATETQFQSKWGDPNLMKNKADLKSFLTRGYSDKLPSSRVRTQLGGRRNDSRRSRGGLIPKDQIKRVIQQQVLYLMIVNMPTDEELAAASGLLDERSSAVEQ